MPKIAIKPLSVNDAYRGRRFATPELTQYKRDISLLLPKMKVPEGKLEVVFEFGISSKLADYDNFIKATQDAISECLGFNDRVIYGARIKKVDVSKGEEYLVFSMAPFSG
jgi:Holliday junction resolvase RusA-like endonuclease